MKPMKSSKLIFFTIAIFVFSHCSQDTMSDSENIAFNNAVAQHLLNKILCDPDILDNLDLLKEVSENNLEFVPNYRNKFKFNLNTIFNSEVKSVGKPISFQESSLRVEGNSIYLLEERSKITAERSFKSYNISDQFRLSSFEKILYDENLLNFSLNATKQSKIDFNIYFSKPYMSSNAIYQLITFVSITGRHKCTVELSMDKKNFDIHTYSYGNH